jgi:hypothetical protein
VLPRAGAFTLSFGKTCGQASVTAYCPKSFFSTQLLLIIATLPPRPFSRNLNLMAMILDDLQAALHSSLLQLHHTNCRLSIRKISRSKVVTRKHLSEHQNTLQAYQIRKQRSKKIVRLLKRRTSSRNARLASPMSGHTMYQSTAGNSVIRSLARELKALRLDRTQL